MRKFSTSTTGCNGLNLCATRSSYSTTYAIGYRLRHIDFGRPGVRGSNVMDGGGLLLIRTSRMDINYESVISVACVAIFGFWMAKPCSTTIVQSSTSAYNVLWYHLSLQPQTKSRSISASRDFSFNTQYSSEDLVLQPFKRSD